MSLCDLDCRHARAKEKAYRLTDAGGLYLDVMPSGKRIWRYRYKFFGKEKLLTIGPYPTTSLVKAREKRDNARQSLEAGVDPSQQKQDEKKLARFKNAQTFEAVAREWHAKNIGTWTPNYGKHVLNRLQQNMFPMIGHLPVANLTVQHILTALRKIEGRERYDLAYRVLQVVGQIMRYAVITGRVERDITSDLKGALKKYKKGHFAAISPDELPQFLQMLETNDARLFKQTKLAIKLILLTFVRTSELIQATWSEFDLERAQWVIPAERMKMRIEHRVPLSRQTISILKQLQELYGKTGYILPSVVRRNKPISNNTILKALERLGYHKVMTGHGFRALAMSAIKEKLGYRHEVVDRQLAHQPKNQVDQAYDRAQFLAERTTMMQEWADYIDAIAIPARQDSDRQPLQVVRRTA